MRYRFYTADVFTDRIFGGNPLAVFPDAQGLSVDQMQLIAKEFNYSESTFVLPAETSAGTRRVRIFTPAAEMPFAGHPTVGTAFVLCSTGAVPLTGAETRVVLEEGVGPVPVTVRAERGVAVSAQFAAARLPEFGPEPPGAAELAGMLSLAPEDLFLEPYRPQAVSCGVPFLFVPLKSLGTVRQAVLKRELWEQGLSGFWAPQIYIFAFDAERQGSDLHARMFAPHLGVGEDPATGAAATALAGYLDAHQRLPEGTTRWIVEQGFEMGRPSIIEVEAERAGGALTAIRVGGASVLVSEGTMEIPGL